MNGKKNKSQPEYNSPSKRIKTLETQPNTLFKTLQECGLELKHPPNKCVAQHETIHIILNIKKHLLNHIEYPRNISEFCSDVEKECQKLDVFKHFLFPNIVRNMDDSSDILLVNESVFKILLNVPILQSKLIDFIFEKALDLAADSKCGPWIQMILKCLSTLDCIADSDKISCHLINLLDVASEKMVRLEVIISIPDLVGDQQHNIVATELSRILSEDHTLIPAILDCLSYLCLADHQYEQLQQKTLNILSSLSECSYFPNFIKFLLTPGIANENSYNEVVQGLRNALGWSTTIAKTQEIATSQVLTASAIRSAILSSKAICGAWLKAMTSCKLNTDHKPIDFIILLVLFSISEEKQKQVENLLKKQIKLDILKESMLDESFEKFKPILKDYLKTCINLANSLLKTKTDSMLVSFGAQIYILMLSQLEDCAQIVVAELLQLGLDCKQCVMNILQILNNVALKDMSLLKPQSLQMLTLLDRTDDMNLNEIKAVMNLVCGLAFYYENSLIRDDIHMIIRKELSSSNPKIKIQGIVAGIYAVKYLMVANANEDQTIEFPEDGSSESVSHLIKGDQREAAQIIELISRSTRQFPDMIAFFYDEFSKIMLQADNTDKNFLAWLSDAVTSDLEQNFIVETIEVDKIDNIPLCVQYRLNTDSEVDKVIAINIASLTLTPKEDINIIILSPLFQLVQTLHYKQHNGDLSSIDALLGCEVIMPKFDVDLIEDMDDKSISNIADCLVHCMNWFRELLNAFATQTDDALKRKILNRVEQIEQLEVLLSQILTRSKFNYKAPQCTFSISKYTGDHTERKMAKIQTMKQKTNKKNHAQNETLVTDTARTQATQNRLTIKNKLDIVQSLPLRPLNMNLLHLLKTDLVVENDSENFTVKTLIFLLRCVTNNTEKIIVSKIKRKTFLSKQRDSLVYDPQQAEDCAKSINEVLPQVTHHLGVIKSYLEEHVLQNTQTEYEGIPMDAMNYIFCLELILDFYTIFFKWIGFKNGHNGLLKSSIRVLANAENSDATISLKELVLNVMKYLQKIEPCCLQLSTAMSLINLMNAVKEHSDNKTVIKIVTEVAKRFLEKQWRTPEGELEKGLAFNQRIDTILAVYFRYYEVEALKSLVLQLAADIQLLSNRNEVLSHYKCISKTNFPVLYRNLGLALYECTKNRLSKGLTNSEHISLWKDVVSILKIMSEIAKSLNNRNNLSAFFKKSLPLLKLFLSHGIPILELQFKSETQEVLEILKILQQSTRFLQSLCCHSRLKNDTVLMSKVPYMRQLLETLIYKVKAVLTANKCSQAFWMGNLKNKNIHGEVIATQQTVASEDSAEDCDDQLPEDDESDDSDEVMINPDSNLLHEKQKYDGCWDNIAHIFDIWERSCDAVGVFCDVSKASDCVDHVSLIEKLSYYRLKGAALDLIRS